MLAVLFSMPWASDPSVKIDRFDGRALLDYLPTEIPSMVESGLRFERDEDGLGDELRFERWFDLLEKTRLKISEEQCLIEMEAEWNNLVARHHALIGKTLERKQEAPPVTGSNAFAFNYGTRIVQHPDGEQEGSLVGHLMGRELTPMEEENILEHLDELSEHDRDILDKLGEEYAIANYYQMLRIAKREQDDRVQKLKMTAINLERAIAGKKPLKMSEIQGLDDPDRRRGQSRREGKRRSRRDRSHSPAFRTTRRSSPSYDPYDSDESGSRSPKKETQEYISEFRNDSAGEMSDHDVGILETMVDSDRSKRLKTTSSADSSKRQAQPSSSMALGNSPAKGSAADMKLSLVEKLKQRMRQGLDQSARVKEANKAIAKETSDIDPVHANAKKTETPTVDRRDRHGQGSSESGSVATVEVGRETVDHQDTIVVAMTITMVTIIHSIEVMIKNPAF
ncbi:hypothetical protein BGZ94_003342 [Podila epigama]|nr:hypothetical protein BGZ94_003342 [Podila epigama]